MLVNACCQSILLSASLFCRWTISLDDDDDDDVASKEWINLCSYSCSSLGITVYHTLNSCSYPCSSLGITVYHTLHSCSYPCSSLGITNVSRVLSDLFIMFCTLILIYIYNTQIPSPWSHRATSLSLKVTWCPIVMSLLHTKFNVYQIRKINCFWHEAIWNGLAILPIDTFERCFWQYVFERLKFNFFTILLLTSVYSTQYSTFLSCLPAHHSFTSYMLRSFRLVMLFRFGDKHPVFRETSFDDLVRDCLKCEVEKVIYLYSVGHFFAVCNMWYVRIYKLFIHPVYSIWGRCF